MMAVGTGFGQVFRGLGEPEGATLAVNAPQLPVSRTSMRCRGVVCPLSIQAQLGVACAHSHA